MKSIPHPSEYIEPHLVKSVRAAAPEAEQLKQLHPAQLAIIHEQNWFNLFVPEAYNGLGLALPKALRLEEALAWTDGSLGWTVTLCAGAGWFSGFLNPQLGELVFSDKKVCLAGSGKDSGIATIVEEGYSVNGYWDYATGANAATAFTANCRVEENGMLLKNEDGSPQIRSFLFLKEEVTIHENWKRIGMIATGSHSFGVKNLRLGSNRSFLIDQQHLVLKDPVYQYPFLQFAETTLAVNSSGMAMRFLDLCKEIFENKSNPALLSRFNDAIKKMEAIRQLFYRVVSGSWQENSSGVPLSSATLEHLSIVSKELAIVSRQMMDELYPYCGMQAANPDTEINRIWRNLHTASQHSLFNG